MYTIFGYDRVSQRLLSPECTAEEWQQGIDLVRMIEDAGIHFFASYGIGFDEQKPGIADRILKFSHDAGIDLAEFYINTPFPGTPFGRTVEAEEAKQLGMVFEIYHEDELQQRARDLAGRFCHASTDAIGLAKNILNQTFEVDLATALDLEAHAQSVARSGDYHLDSVERFNSKQPLRFNWDSMDQEEAENAAD